MKETNHWTPEEIAILTEGYKTGMTAGAIAARIGRTENAVYNRAKNSVLHHINEAARVVGRNFSAVMKIVSTALITIALNRAERLEKVIKKMGAFTCKGCEKRYVGCTAIAKNT